MAYKNNYKNEDYIINRFPIMVAVGYVIAKRAGYEEDMAKSLGLALATKYAVWKNHGGGFYSPARQKEKNRYWDYEDRVMKEKNLDSILFCGESFLTDGNIVKGLQGVRNGLKDFDPYKFERYKNVIEQIKPGSWTKLINAVKKELKQWEDYDFSKAVFSKSFMRFWKEIRDKFREKSFYFN